MQRSTEICDHCGVIFAKLAAQTQWRQELHLQAEQAWTSTFTRLVGFRIHQQRQALEMVSLFEMRNRYDVLFTGAPYASGCIEERSHSWFNLMGRQLLGGCRPARLDVRDGADQLLLSLDKRFGLYFHELQVNDPAGQMLGVVRRQLHPLRPVYAIFDAKGLELLRIEGPWFSLPFFGQRYNFYRGSEYVGHLVKRWGGLWKESFTDADNYQARLSPRLPELHRALLFAAVLLIDFGHHETSPGA